MRTHTDTHTHTHSWGHFPTAPRRQVYRFGVVLARLDAIMYDMARGSGVDVSRAGASTSAAVTFAASRSKGGAAAAADAAGLGVDSGAAA